MIALRDLIFNNTVSSINNELIIPDYTCGFSDSVCENITKFKSLLIKEINEGLNNKRMNLADTSVPDYVDKFKLDKMLAIFIQEINNKIMVTVKSIILEGALPCKACKPCEKMVEDLIAYANKRIDEIKDIMISFANIYILDNTLDWTITDSASIIAKKQQLVDVSYTAVSKESGYVDMYTEFIIKLKIEEEALLNTVAKTIDKT